MNSNHELTSAETYHVERVFHFELNIGFMVTMTLTRRTSMESSTSKNRDRNMYRKFSGQDRICGMSKHFWNHWSFLLGPPLSEQKVAMKNWPPNFLFVCLPALSMKSCIRKALKSSVSLNTLENREIPWNTLGNRENFRDFTLENREIPSWPHTIPIVTPTQYDVSRVHVPPKNCFEPHFYPVFRLKRAWPKHYSSHHTPVTMSFWRY